MEPDFRGWFDGEAIYFFNKFSSLFMFTRANNRDVYSLYEVELWLTLSSCYRLCQRALHWFCTGRSVYLSRGEPRWNCWIISSYQIACSTNCRKEFERWGHLTGREGKKREFHFRKYEIQQFLDLTHYRRLTVRTSWPQLHQFCPFVS